MTKRDSLGRRRFSKQDDAIRAVNEKTTHGEGIVATQVHLAAEAEAVAWFKSLPPRERGKIVDRAFAAKDD